MSGGAKGRSARRRRRDPRRRASPRGGGRRGSGGRQGSPARADLELFVLLRRQRLDPVPALPALSLREGRDILRRVLAREIARHRRGRGSADGSSPAPLSRRRGRAPRVGGPVASAARGRAARVCANARGGRSGAKMQRKPFLAKTQTDVWHGRSFSALPHEKRGTSRVANRRFRFGGVFRFFPRAEILARPGLSARPTRAPTEGKRGALTRASPECASFSPVPGEKALVAPTLARRSARPRGTHPRSASSPRELRPLDMGAKTIEELESEVRVALPATPREPSRAPRISPNDRQSRALPRVRREREPRAGLPRAARVLPR